MNTHMSAGDVIDDVFRLEVLVAKGGQGRLWRGQDVALGRAVAIKLLPAQDPWRRPDATEQLVRAIREATAMARLLHSGIATVHRVGEHQQRPYIVSTWYPGADLRTILRDRPPSRAVALSWLRHVAEALQHAHSRGVIHCDLKPENIVIRDDVAINEAPVLVDFGLARGAGLTHRTSVQRAGTAAYLPPEAGHQPPSPRSDQWALAQVARELLEGCEDDDRRQSVEQAKAVAAVLSIAQSDAPADRYGSVGVFMDALIAAARPERSVVAPVALSSESQADIEAMAALAMCVDASVVERAFPLAWRQERWRRLHERGVLARPDPRSLISRAAVRPWLERLSGEQRRRLHRRFAEALERGDVCQGWVADDVAHHWLHGGRARRAAEVLLRQASGESDHRRRLERTRRAAHLLRGDEEAHIEACVAWGDVAAALGWREDLERAVAAALQSTAQLEAPVSAGLWRLRGQMRRLSGEHNLAVEAWEAALDEASSPLYTTLARIGLARTLSRLGRPQDALARLGPSPTQPDPGLRTRWLVARGIAEEGVGEPHALPTLRSAAREATLSGDPYLVSTALLAVAEGALRQERWVEATDAVQEASLLLREQTTALVSGTVHLVAGRIAAGQSRWQESYGACLAAAVVYRGLRLRAHERNAWSLALKVANAMASPRLARRALGELQGLAQARQRG